MMGITTVEVDYISAGLGFQELIGTSICYTNYTILHIETYVCMLESKCVCVCVYIYMYVYIYICIYTHIHTDLGSPLANATFLPIVIIHCRACVR